MIGRRKFVGLLGGAAAWPMTARAQQAALPVVGYLGGSSPRQYAPFVAAFMQGLNETGYVEGRNVAIEYRWADGQYDRLPPLAAELVGRQVAVIVTTDTASTLAAKAATQTIPIAFMVGSDPVEVGLVASLNRPGGNVTGVSNLNVELGPKRLELLHELLPTANIVALLANPTNHNEDTVSRDLQAAARTLGLLLHVLHATTDGDLDAAFGNLVQLRASALLVTADPFFNARSEQIAALAMRHAMPTIYEYHEYAAAGGLMSYGGSLTDVHRRVGDYTGRILGGAKPADLPVQRSTKVELIINLKTAKTLGLTVPLALLTRADEVIE
jgi:putative ABC transport system substrate-binding protein